MNCGTFCCVTRFGGCFMFLKLTSWSKNLPCPCSASHSRSKRRMSESRSLRAELAVAK